MNRRIHAVEEAAESPLVARLGLNGHTRTMTAFGRILLQNYFEDSDPQDCVAKSTPGETMISVGAPVGSFIARTPPVQEFCNRIGR